MALFLPGRRDAARARRMLEPMDALVPAHLDHTREWARFDYCYPVISRRSGGVSLGVNLNPVKRCNFNCVYCEVDRCTPPRRKDVDLDQLVAEMAALMDLVASGELFARPPFDTARPAQRRLNDLAFSGDGEPTTASCFAACVARLADLKRARGLDAVKLVLITDSTRLQAPEVAAGLETLMANQGEIWAKLDAGTEAHYRQVNRSLVPYSRILENLLIAGRRWPLTLQTLLLEWQGRGISDAEFEAYLACVRGLREQGAQFRGVQLYTVARPTPEPDARPLAAAELDRRAAQLRAELPDLPVEVFYGPDRA